MKETLKYLDEIIEKYDLKNKSRKREIVMKRQYFAYFCFTNLSMNPNDIAIKLNQDRCTMSHSVKMASNLIFQNDKVWHENVNEIRNDLSECPLFKFRSIPTLKAFTTQIINRLFEVKSMEDVEGLKSYVNANINPKMLK